MVKQYINVSDVLSSVTQGCNTLRELLSHREVFGDFRPVFVGDLINRGTFS